MPFSKRQDENVCFHHECHSCSAGTVRLFLMRQCWTDYPSDVSRSLSHTDRPLTYVHLRLKHSPVCYVYSLHRLRVWTRRFHLCRLIRAAVDHFLFRVCPLILQTFTCVGLALSLHYTQFLLCTVLNLFYRRSLDACLSLLTQAREARLSSSTCLVVRFQSLPSPKQTGYTHLRLRGCL